MKKTLIIGATNNSARYANLAALRLVERGHDIINIGIKSGDAAGVPIEKPGNIYSDVDTITMYLGSEKQVQYYDYILNTNPKRIVFNPGAENPELKILAEQRGIDTIEACTLVLLATGQY